MARVYKRGGKWWIDFQQGGRRYREPAKGAQKKKEAEDFLSLRQSEKIQESIYGAKPTPDVTTFGDFADYFLATDSPDKKSKDRDSSILEMLKVAWKGKALCDVTTRDVDEYKAKRCRNRSAATVNKELQVIKRMFRMALEWGKLTENPAANVKKLRVSNSRVRHLDPDEMERLMEKLPDWLQPIVLFARNTGARRGEILGLTWNDVDLKHGLLTFRETKNGDDGTVEMNQTVKELLQSFPSPIDRTQRVFPPVDTMKLRRAWERACRKARIGVRCLCETQSADGKPNKKCGRCEGTAIIPNFRFHDLRHQAATDLLTRGADLNDVRDFLRHKTMNMTLRYAHLVRARRQRTAALLDIPASDLENHRLGSGHGTKTGTTGSSAPVTPESPSSSLA